MKPLAPVTVDGWIYVLIALFGAIGASLGSDDAAKFITPATLFWMKMFATSGGAGCLALKMYRSTTFAEYKTAKNGTYHTGDTTVQTKTSLNINEIQKSTPSPTP
jgi:hypothetical protein